MSIEKDGFDYIIVCDICGKESTEFFDEFMEAVDFKKDKSNGWFIRKNKDDWYDICSTDCLEYYEEKVKGNNK